MSNDSENAAEEMPVTYQHISNDPSVAASIVSAVASNASLPALDTISLIKGCECMPGTITQQRFLDLTLEACRLNFPAVRLAPFTAAELVDLKTKGGPPKTKAVGPKTKGSDPERLPDSVLHMSAFYIEKPDTLGIHMRSWTDLTRAHIDRTCTRMWRPAKRERQEIRNNNITTSQVLNELYIRCFPDKIVAENCSGPRKWEVLLPHLVTFVLCDVEPEDDAPSSLPGAELPAASSSSAASTSQSAAAGPSSPGPSSSSSSSAAALPRPAPAPSTRSPAPNPKSNQPSKSDSRKSKSKSKPSKPKPGRHQRTLRPKPPTPSPPPTPPPPDPVTPPRPQGRPQKPVIRYLPVGTRDRQSSADFCAALTAAFACERVLAPDLKARWVVAEARMRRRWMGGFLEEEEGEEVKQGGEGGEGDVDNGEDVYMGEGKGKGKEVDRGEVEGKGKEVDEGKGKEVDGEKGEGIDGGNENEIEKRKRRQEFLDQVAMVEAVGDLFREIRKKMSNELREMGIAPDGLDGQEQGDQETDSVKDAEVNNGQAGEQKPEPECDGNGETGKGKQLDTTDYGERRERRFYDILKGIPIHWPLPEPRIEQRTMLVFAAGACVGPRGGIGVVTKETVHFHEKQVWARIVEAEQRLSDAGRKSLFHGEDLRKVGLCSAALEKPGRGFRPDLHRAVPPQQVECALLGGAHELAMERWSLDIDPAQFGYVESRYRPAWRTRYDVNSDERYYYIWGRARQKLEESAKRYRIDSGAGEGGGVDGQAVDSGEGAEDGGRSDGKGEGGKANNGEEDDESEDDEEGGAPLYADMDCEKKDQMADGQGGEDEDEDEDEDDANEDMESEDETEEEIAESNNGNEKPSKPKPKKHVIRATPNRVAARALLAAVQIVPFDFGHCTRLIIATDSEHAIEMATNRLQNMLERGLPFRTARGQPVEDEDIWWEFAGTVKDLAYQGVEVAIMRSREGEGIRLPVGDGDGYVFGMDQAIKAAKHAARQLWRRDKQAKERHEKRGDLEFVRWVNLYA